MVANSLSLGPLVILGLLLIYAAASDLRTRTIDNWVSIAMAVGAPVWWLASGLEPWPGMVWQFGFGLLVFAVMFGLWTIRIVGGADVKLIGALALWLPPGERMTTFFVMAMAGAVLSILAFVMVKTRRRAPGEKRRPVEVPYGVAIAAGGLFFLLQTTN